MPAKRALRRSRACVLLAVSLACGCTQPPDADPDADAGAPSHPSILVGEVTNARDLGGTPLGELAEVAPNRLYRGAPLAGLSPAGCDELAGRGIRTVVDLRTESERESTPESPCVHELAQVVLAPLPVPYSVSAEDYIADLSTTESIHAAFGALGDEASYPLYFHCTWGRDRTGVLAAVILSALGADRDAILEEYLLSSATVGAYPSSLEAMLDELERRGGIDAYLESAGIPEAWVETLRSVARSNRLE